MNFETLQALRDSRGLNPYEGFFLFAVISRGDNCFATAETIMGDAGMGRTAFYSTRKSLIAKGLLVETRREGTTTLYSVNVDALKNLVPGRVPVPDGDRGTPAGWRHTPVPDGGTIRRTKEEKIKEENPPPSFERRSTGPAPAEKPGGDSKIATTGEPDHRFDAVLGAAKTAGYEGITPAEVKTVVRVYVEASAKGLPPLAVTDLVREYFRLRALPKDDLRRAKSIRLLEWMIANALNPKAAGGMPSAPSNVREAKHASGGKRVTSMDSGQVDPYFYADTIAESSRGTA